MHFLFTETHAVTTLPLKSLAMKRILLFTYTAIFLKPVSSVLPIRRGHIADYRYISYQEICNSITKRRIVKCKNTLREDNYQIFIVLFSQNELLFQVCLTIKNTASPVNRDFLTLCSSLGKRGKMFLIFFLLSCFENRHTPTRNAI